MDKSIIRQTIIEQQEEAIATLEQAVNAFQKESDMDETETHDPEDYSHQEEATILKRRMEEQLDFAYGDLARIKEVSLDPCDSVKSGALIETDYMVFYVGISSLPFQVGEKKVIGISTNAPIYLSLKKKKVGDSVKVGSQSHTITAIL